MIKKKPAWPLVSGLKLPVMSLYLWALIHWQPAALPFLLVNLPPR